MGILDQEVPKVETFAELEASDNLDSGGFLDTLHEYATSGWAINGSVVVSLAERLQLSEQELVELASLSVRGLFVQAKNRMHSTPEGVMLNQSEYLHVLNYAASQIRGDSVASVELVAE